MSAQKYGVHIYKYFLKTKYNVENKREEMTEEATIKYAYYIVQHGSKLTGVIKFLKVEYYFL
jgi:hypothetical protein